MILDTARARTGDPFIFLQLAAANETAADLTDVYLGLFADWDILDRDLDPDDTSTNDFAAFAPALTYQMGAGTGLLRMAAGALDSAGAADLGLLGGVRRLHRARERCEHHVGIGQHRDALGQIHVAGGERIARVPHL